MGTAATIIPVLPREAAKQLGRPERVSGVPEEA